ncbi:hypothetical protein CBS101457_005943 [Exobasidium rhododendri]|nr:hypothetical protein CBS101457_005943 [Exobasidium rhododendri]
MALDISLFTLTFQRRSDDPAVLDLLPFHPAAIALSPPSSSLTFPPSESPKPLYSFSRARTVDYNVQLVDHLTSIPLSSISSPRSTDKIRKIQLYNPSEAVLFEKKNTTFRQDWRWTWQDQEYLARKDGKGYVVEAVRKPDPEIDVARYTPATKTRPAFLQVLDYNIQRLDVTDRRGLEILILMATCTLLDADYDEKHKEGLSGNIYLSDRITSSEALNSTSSSSSAKADRLSSSGTLLPDVQSKEANELVIDVHTPVDVFIRHAIQLMRQDQGGDGLHLIILKATSPQVTPKAIQIAAEIKVEWHRLEAAAKGRTLDPLPGSKNEIAEELYQYVRGPSTSSLSSSSVDSPMRDTTGTERSKAGARARIKLDAPSVTTQGSSLPISGHASPGKAQQHKQFAPPPSQLDIYLSKERIDEFDVFLPSSKSSAPAFSHHASALPSRRESSPKIPIVPPKDSLQVPSDGSPGNAKKILGKFRLLKGHASER